MKSKIFINLLLMLLTNLALAKTKLPVLVEVFTEVPSVEADVTIKGGQVSSSNCDDLTAANTDEIRYSLEFVDSKYLCVPDESRLSVITKVDLDSGIELTLANMKEHIEAPSRQYEIDEKLTTSLFASSSQTPSCDLKIDGTINYESCECAGDGFIFDLTSKTCSRDSSILSYYIYNCSDQFHDISKVLNIAGESVVPPLGVTFAMCSFGAEQYYVLEHELVYKILLFAFLKESILSSMAEKMDVANVRLFISKAEITDYKIWADSYQGASSEKLLQKIQSFANQLEKYSSLDDLIEVED